MKLNATRFFFLLMVASISFNANAQQNFFTDVPESLLQKAGDKRIIVPEKYRTLQLDTASLLLFLRLLPSEQNVLDRNTAPVLEVPMPDGSMAKFHIWESSMMEPGLAQAFPQLKTFTGQGIDDRTATIKLDWTELGFHAMILSPLTGQVFIDPYAQLSLTSYISYYKTDYKKKGNFRELAPEINPLKNANARAGEVLAGPCIGTQLRTYRLAVACTGEYAVAVTSPASPTKGLVLSAITTSINRVNAVYETDLAVRMVLVANNSKIIYINAATDQFTANNDGFTLLDESQLVIGDSIGTANYDIGHTFSTGAGGVASLGSVCVHQNGTVRGDLLWNYKARGVTGSDFPKGDAYDIDFVAHEMGHQFGANHSFNNAGSCGSVPADQNAEPGSGVTIMAYAGVCANDNILFNSIPYFHAVSYDKIAAFTGTGNGASCDVSTPTGNTPPVVNAGADYTIPISTPFILTGSATDVNGDALTYSWEQADVGGPNGASNSPSGNAPLFRSFAPVSNGTRYFPRLQDVISNTTTLGERLPNYGRTMQFRLTVRDNRAGGGGVCSDDNTITVSSAAGPFTVTYPTASGVVWNVNDFFTVTWNPSGTASAPVNCANVALQLSTDGGNTFPVTLLASTPNDGSEEIQVPNNISTTVRLRVIAVGNIFYDMSNSNFRIQNSPTSTFVFNNPLPVQVCSAASGTATLKTGSLNGFATNIALSASMNPPGTTVSFGSSSLAPGASTTVTLNNTNTLAPGSYTVRVTGIAGAVTKTKDIQFIVGGGPAPATLSAPANNATGQSTTPSFNWAAVSGATSYTLEISTLADFSNIIQTVPNISSLPHALAVPLQENTEYHWRVRATNACGTGNPSVSPGRFKTWLSSCKPSTDVPKVISASGTPTVTSTIVIPAANAVTITDVNVIGLKGNHAWVGDLVFSLVGPNNDTVLLMNRVCDGGWEDFDAHLDDQSPFSSFSCPPTGPQIVQPAEPLSAFNGISSAGTWKLLVRDLVNQDGGNLTGWGLNFNSNSTTNCVTTSTPLATIYTFTGNGNWNVASNWASNTVPPASLPSGSAIVIDHVAGGVCTLNVNQTIATGATLTVLTGKNLVVPGTLVIQ